jgi:hypothetical protein
MFLLNSAKVILNKKNNTSFFYKIREQEGRTGLAWGIGTSWRRKKVGKGRVNIVQVLCTHVGEWTNETC